MNYGYSAVILSWIPEHFSSKCNFYFLQRRPQQHSTKSPPSPLPLLSLLKSFSPEGGLTPCRAEKNEWWKVHRAAKNLIIPTCTPSFPPASHPIVTTTPSLSRSSHQDAKRKRSNRQRCSNAPPRWNSSSKVVSSSSPLIFTVCSTSL